MAGPSSSSTGLRCTARCTLHALRAAPAPTGGMGWRSGRFSAQSSPHGCVQVIKVYKAGEDPKHPEVGGAGLLARFPQLRTCSCSAAGRVYVHRAELQLCSLYAGTCLSSACSACSSGGLLSSCLAPIDQPALPSPPCPACPALPVRPYLLACRAARCRSTWTRWPWGTPSTCGGPLGNLHIWGRGGSRE